VHRHGELGMHGWFSFPRNLIASRCIAQHSRTPPSPHFSSSSRQFPESLDAKFGIASALRSQYQISHL
jgi:hypothetical protein